jgi:hypothetical protein
MDYRKIYNSIVSQGKNRLFEGYTESHHVIPRCMGGTDDPKNLVNLTAEEHYVCHQLLVKIYPDDIGLVRAAMFMTASGAGPKRSGNKTYGWLKRRFSEYMKGPNNPQKLNPRSGDKHHYFGKGRPPSTEWLTTDGREILADKMLGEKNPCAGIKPWNHPRATDYSKSVWEQADKIYQVWTDNNKPSYCKLYTLMNNKCYINESKVIGPYMNMVKYFRKGWIPTQDTEWINI